jgi:hypothetical protein
VSSGSTAPSLDFLRAVSQIHVVQWRQHLFAPAPPLTAYRHDPRLDRRVKKVIHSVWLARRGSTTSWSSMPGTWGATGIFPSI